MPCFETELVIWNYSIALAAAVVAVASVAAAVVADVATAASDVFAVVVVAT